MNIIWDDEKNKKLTRERGISIDEIAKLILQRKYVDILKHPRRPEQKIFVVPIKSYIHAIPFVFDDNENIVLKTPFPSRKLHKKYGQKNHENKT